MNSICIFCGSSKGNKAAYIEAAVHLGKTLAKRNIKIVYGAGNVGLMGEIADAALAENGYVIGVIPEFLKGWEVCHDGLSELTVTETMHQRKQLMSEISDGFIALPGGFGTLDELFEILTWKQLQLHQKPIGLLNVNGYYDHAIAHIKQMVAEGFLKEANLDLLIIENDLEALLEKMNSFPVRETEGKWIT